MPDRLVIRIKLPSKEPHAAPVRPRLSGGVLMVIVAAAAVALIFVGIAIFRSEPTPAPAPTEPAPAVATETKPVGAEPVEPQVREPPVAPPSRVSEVIPEVPRSALNTISGTIRITIRVIVDKEGAVVAATTDERGPSRYFERLAVEAAKQWTFGPATSSEQRVRLVRFYFKRSGVTARAISP